jgi:hypothetical protein
VGHYHEDRERLRSQKHRCSNFKEVTLKRQYDEILDRSKRYRNRQENWNFLGDQVGIRAPAPYQAGRYRPSTSARIAAARSRAAQNRPAFCPRNKGHRRNQCRPQSRNN